MSNTPRIILGAAGTGKTTQLLEHAQNYLDSGAEADGMMFLTPSRTSATRMRELIANHTQRTLSTVPTRAWQSYAFDILRRAQIQGLLPGVELSPKLISGPEQDVIISELLQGHTQGYGKIIIWPQELKEAVHTEGFRHEIRDFFDRIAEYAIDTQDIENYAQQLNIRSWALIAQLYKEYQQIRRLRMPNAFDPATLIHEAQQVLTRNPTFLAEERERFKLLLIDDFQEATPSIYRLLETLCSPETSPAPAPQTVIALCTDTVVQGFRGARPDKAKELPRILGDYETLSLNLSHRMPKDIVCAYSTVTERIPPVAHMRYDRQPQCAPAADPTATAEETSQQEPALDGYLVQNVQQENRLLAQMILEKHLYENVPYHQCAIIVRNTGAIARIERTLMSHGIPVSSARTLNVLSQEPAVRPFLDALAIAIHLYEQEQDLNSDAHPVSESGISTDIILSLLQSRLGGATAMDVRRLRQQLRAEELKSGGTRPSDELLLEALYQRPHIAARGADRAVHRIHHVLSAGVKALSQEGATAESVLWALWESSELAHTWRQESLNGEGLNAQRAHRDLDAMLGLFEAASRYTEQMPGASAFQFLNYMMAQDIPMDTLTRTTRVQGHVEILTPALAAGREWDYVYIAGLQEGIWPNTTVRGSLLETHKLTDILDIGLDAARHITSTDRVRQTRHDELRMFATALSRAKKQVRCTAVMSEDEFPSEFFDLVVPGSHEGRTTTEVRRPMTLRALVAELRQWAEQYEQNPEPAHHAIQILRKFNDLGQTRGYIVPGASPDSWWGLSPLSSQGSAFGEEAPIPMSPSRLETVHRSPLEWFVSESRAEAATDASRSLGNVVHELAEQYPHGPGYVLEEQLAQTFQKMNLPDTWETQKIYERAQKMVRKFASYVAELSQHQRELSNVEGSFKVFVPGKTRNALLVGRIDRLEKNQETGRYAIIDLKTGRTAPSQKEKIPRHPQLAAYQVALEAGIGEKLAQGEDSPEARFSGLTSRSGGAFLIQLGTDTKTYREQQQEPLTEEDLWAVELIQQAAELIAQEYFQARHTSAQASGYGIQCKLPEICPLCARGRQVTQ